MENLLIQIKQNQQSTGNQSTENSSTSFQFPALNIPQLNQTNDKPKTNVRKNAKTKTNFVVDLKFEFNWVCYVCC